MTNHPVNNQLLLEMHFVDSWEEHVQVLKQLSVQNVLLPEI
jgi:DNA-directed RNA polymerase subunit H (RpoH/RPB5)